MSDELKRLKMESNNKNYYTKEWELSKITLILLCIAPYILAYWLFSYQSVREAFNSQFLLWYLAIALLVFDVISFFQDPSRYTSKKKCFGMKCNDFSILTGMSSLFIDFFIIFSFLQKQNISFQVKLVVVILGILFVGGFLYYHYKTTDLVNKKEPQEINTIKKPKSLMIKSFRSLVYYMILIISVFMLFQGYTEGNTDKNLTDDVWGRFGGWIEGNKFWLIFSWIFSVLGAYMDYFSLGATTNYTIKEYDLPPQLY